MTVHPQFAAAATKPRIMRERDIQIACTGYLELDGWRALRTDPVSDRATVEQIRRAIRSHPDYLKLDPLIGKKVRGKGFGELGMADHLYVRYQPIHSQIHRDGPHPDRAHAFGWWQSVAPCQAEVLWIEWKSAKGKPKPHQLAWHTAERARGALTLVAGVDFPASIEGFILWYEQSGLNRRMRPQAVKA